MYALTGDIYSVQSRYMEVYGRCMKCSKDRQHKMHDDGNCGCNEIRQQ